MTLIGAALIADARPALAQAVPVPPEVEALIAEAIAAGESAAASAALSAGLSNPQAQAEIAARTRYSVTSNALAEAVVQGIARYPAHVGAIVQAAVRRAPAYRDEIVRRASLAFPAFAPHITAAAGVAQAPYATPVAATPIAPTTMIGPVATAVAPARPAPPDETEAEDVRVEEDDGPPGPRVAAPAIPLPVPELALVRTDTAPEIDGRLDEAIWSRAAVIANLTQVEPVEGVAPTQPTEVRLLYDTDFLYLGVRAYDSQPGKIVATEMQRDAEFGSDDVVEIVLDTFRDRRSAFLFRVNPRGARADGLIEKSRRVGEDWDGIWYAKASIDRQGWVAEIAIPFKTVSFNPDNTSWGFNIERVVRRNNESSRWAAVSQDRGLTDIADAGILTNLVGIRQGIGLDVKPSATVSHIRGRPDRGDDTEIDPSLDVFYKVTPSLTGALTINTDFAETEVDEREINLTRFDLFFPEKRDFFLQDAGIFQFGGLERNGQPFFSRRIGLDENDEEVDILAGGKITGRVGRLNIGILDVQTDSKTLTPEDEDEDPEQLESKNLFVGRAALNVFEQSTLGMIVTNGNPRSETSNTLIGADFNYRNTSVFGDQLLAADLWVQRSFTGEGEDDGKEDGDQEGGGEMAYGAALEFGGDKFEGKAEFMELDADFNPALGFANRRGIRQYSGEALYRQRFKPGGLVRFADAEVTAQLVTDDVNNRVETAEAEFKPIKLRNDPDDRLELSVVVQHEDLNEEFRIFRADEKKDDIVIPTGSYTFVRYKGKVDSSSSRPVSAGLEVVWGDFFTGTRLDIKPRLTFRPSSFLFFEIEYEQNDVDLPEGDFTTRLVRNRVALQFTPDISWSTLAQYDNVSDSIGVNSRLRWIIEPGNELFLVYNQAFEENEDDDLEATGTEIAAKLGWTFRF